jgi:YesN/AraC family two-component response regulator
VRQILHLLQRRFSGILKNDLEQEFYELLPTIKSYSDIADLLKSIVSDLYSETEKVGDLSRDIIIKADRYIRDNLNKMITLQNACDYLNISQPYLSRIFRTYKKMSFNEYVTSLRIKKSKRVI